MSDFLLRDFQTDYNDCFTFLSARNYQKQPVDAYQILEFLDEPDNYKEKTDRYDYFLKYLIENWPNEKRNQFTENNVDYYFAINCTIPYYTRARYYWYTYNSTYKRWITRYYYPLSYNYDNPDQITRGHFYTQSSSWQTPFSATLGYYTYYFQMIFTNWGKAASNWKVEHDHPLWMNRDKMIINQLWNNLGRRLLNGFYFGEHNEKRVYLIANRFPFDGFLLQNEWTTYYRNDPNRINRARYYTEQGVVNSLQDGQYLSNTYWRDASETFKADGSRTKFEGINMDTTASYSYSNPLYRHPNMFHSTTSTPWQPE